MFPLSLFPRPRCNSRAPDPRSCLPPRPPHLLPLWCRASALLLLVPVSAAFAPVSLLRAVRPIQALPGRHVGNARLRAEATRAGDLRSPRQGGAKRSRFLPSLWQRQPSGRMPRSPPRASPPKALVSRLWPAPESAGTRGLGLRESEAGAHAKLNMPSGACAHVPCTCSIAHKRAQSRRRTAALFCAQMLPVSSLNRLALPRHLPSRARVRSAVSASPLAQLSFSAWAPAGILWAILSIPLVALTTLVGVTPPPELPTADMSGQVCVPPLAVFPAAWRSGSVKPSSPLPQSTLLLSASTPLSPPLLLSAHDAFACAPHPRCTHTPLAISNYHVHTHVRSHASSLAPRNPRRPHTPARW